MRRLAFSARTVVVAASLATLAASVAFCATPSMIGPGAGGTTEVRYVPSAERPIKLRLDVTVWGAGKPVKDRFRDVRLRYTIGGALPEQVVEGRLILEETNRERFEFTVLPYAGGTSGPLSYSFDMIFDGKPSPSRGLQHIVID